MHADLLGWMAAALMVATFACTQATRLRPLAVATNLAFIGYGALAGLMPVLVLHLVLLPVNLWRWWPLVRGAAPLAWARPRLAIACRRVPCALVTGLLLLPALVACGGGDSDPDANASPPPAPLELTAMYRQWEFTRILGRLSKPGDTTPVEHRSGGEVQATAQLGAYYARPPYVDDIPNHEIYSSSTGMTYWVEADAPSGFKGAERPIGAKTHFSQQQLFVKQSENATLEYVVSSVFLLLSDANAAPADGNDCPISVRVVNEPIWECSAGRCVQMGSYMRIDPNEVFLNCNDAMRANAEFDFVAERLLSDGSGRRRRLHYASAYVELYGSRNSFDWQVSDSMFEQSWERGDFEVGLNENNGILATLRLAKPMVVKVPLDDVKVGETILVDATVTTLGYDYRQRESSAHAYLRDPARAGGAQVRMTGLAPVPLTTPFPRQPEEDPTPACTTGADPTRGTIAFARTQLSAPELPGLGVPVTLVRSGGAVGEVSVLLQTLEGSASAATDYEDATQRVRFRDGQTQRTVRIPLRLDGVPEFDETVLLRLSEPRGCVALGASTEAVLTLRDDDHPLPPPVSYRVGGSVSGLQGAGLILQDRAQLVSLAVAADGSFTLPWPYAPGSAYDVRIVSMPGQPSQACTLSGPSAGVVQANVTALQVTCEAPVQPGGLDTGFGTFGKVASDLMGSVRAIARQSSGHLVAISGTRMVRFTPDGRHDAAFGGGKGFVDNLLPTAGGEVFDIAVGPDDRIVVAGRQLQPSRSPPFFQMAAARFLPDGTPDAGFGSGGVATVRMGGPSENARRVLVQPDGRVVLVGQAAFQRVTQVTVTDNDIAIVRLNTDGTLDGSFGSGGAVTADALLLDTALAALLQPDGRIFVAGSTVDSSADPTDSLFARFGADGKYELGFARNPAYSALSDEIVDAALQPDGKIVLLIAARGLNAEVALARINPDGSLDTGFGTNGLVRGDFGPHDDAPRAVALQADGKIVVVAQLSDTVGSPDFALLRYLPDGSLDTSFGSGGVMRIDFFGGLGSANDLLVQPDGRIVAAGTARSGLTALATLVRVIP